MLTIERDRAGGDVIDWTELLTSDGPVAVGLGAVALGVAHQIRTYRRDRTQAAVFAGRVSPAERRTAQLASALGRCAVEVDADHAILLWWSPSPVGGTVSALAEWPGTMSQHDSLTDLYDHLEQGPTYRRDVIDTLRRDRWAIIRSDELTPGSTLADLCAARGVALTWHRLIIEESGDVLYVALSYRADDVDETDVRHALRLLSTQIADMMR